MKKMLCAVLAIGMLCCTVAFVGCRKKKGAPESSKEANSNFSTEVGAPALPEWDL